MRTESSIKNLMFAFGGQVAGILISLVSRLVFVRVLTSEYLGLSGLFSNILSMLTLADLGVGTAMTYSLYKPLADKDTEKIKTLMNVYKIAYRIIGIIIIIIGAILIPFLPNLINNMPNISEINYIYFLFVLNSAISYFYSYKRSLIISDQKKYIATIYRYLFYFILNVVQIIILLLTHNYIVFLIVQIMMTLLENIIVSRKADKMYPYLKEKNIDKLDSIAKKEITKNISSMTLHKIGGTVVNATDNLIISRYVGLTEVGIYSNYCLIINAVNAVVLQIFNSIVASVGNLAATESKERLYEVFKRIFFLDFWIYSFASICLIVLFNDFIKLWLGDEYIFSFYIVLVIVINFYLMGMRQTILTFKDALGLYWQDRYKPILESIVNIIASIILVKAVGVVGVFLGTMISTVTVCFWMEAYVLYKYGLNQKFRKFFMKYGFFTIITIIVGTITFFICSMIKEVTIINLVVKILICIIIPNFIYFIILRKTGEFKYYIDLIKTMLYKIKNIKVKLN